ncbi:uncharacterized protein PHACADRAFT_164003 [Phanerochaete carnosa HHB-10118-sp]|uniref:DUF6589 domain-containing protein n=1 Tax=Phanerochaete carnosa (strain HHB-10118-sp) TaxID=650164 RepID=K5VQE2_PHACS|nr:uncharacterized protein PHACADRAFT_164003 [Phanerochaete carnosa HHB-10118-sp]EKM53698.1 hypothetical protein PHACADRAFT_164003 [Phanerochaete carnosa HHB-10118-sp]
MLSSPLSDAPADSEASAHSSLAGTPSPAIFCHVSGVEDVDVNLFWPVTPRIRRSQSLSSLSTLSLRTAVFSPPPQHECRPGVTAPFSWLNQMTILPPLPQLSTPEHLHSELPDEPGTGTSFVPSSPIHGATCEERRESRQQKERRKKEREELEFRKEEGERKRKMIKKVLQTLDKEHCTFGDFILHISNPFNWEGTRRYRGFFSVEGCVEQVLDFWAASSSGRNTMKAWATAYTSKLVSNEGDLIRHDGFLRTDKVKIDKNFTLGFSFISVQDKLQILCLILTAILEAVCTTARQKKTMVESSRKQKETTIMTAALMCLGERSRRNDYVKALLGLFGCVKGAHRQLLTVLSHFGLSLSYSSLTGKSKYHTSLSDIQASLEAMETSMGSDELEATSHSGPANTEAAGKRIQKEKGKSKLGLLRRLSDVCRSATRSEALLDLLAFVYNNINMRFRIAEEVMGQKDSQENGTCSTAFLLWNAKLEHLQTSSLLSHTLSARPLALSDIHLTAEENEVINSRFEHTILHILALFGGDCFAKYADEIPVATPVTDSKIERHKTQIYPLPAVPINESTTRGNAKVVENIFCEVDKPVDSPQSGSIIRLIASDQLSVARIQSIIETRAGHDSLSNSMLWVISVPGLFHYKMALMHGFMETHYSTQSISDPGSLAFHNHVLQRKPIVLSSLPPFRTCRDLVFVSLYARVFHCLLLVSGHSALDDFAEANVPFTKLQGYAQQIWEQYANPMVVYALRQSRKHEELQRPAAEPTGISADNVHRSTKGDMVFENAVLYMRDALLLRKFTDAIKAGDSGRVFYRGMGRPKYAHEMMHLVHHLMSVWPEELCKIVMENWLVNPTGRDNSWVKVDLMQEHLNYWIKAIYRARGSNASWQWLAMIAPCVHILRELAKQVHATFVSHQGSKHTSPNLQRDIDRLMASLDQHGVYTIDEGRCINSENGEVLNVVADEIRGLQEPLQEYNRLFRELQSSIRSKPLVGELYISVPADRLDPGTSTGSAMATTATASDSQDARNQGTAEDADAEIDNETLEDDNDDSHREDTAEASGSEDESDGAGDNVAGEHEDQEHWFSLNNADDVVLDMDAFDDNDDDTDSDKDDEHDGD